LRYFAAGTSRRRRIVGAIASTLVFHPGNRWNATMDDTARAAFERLLDIASSDTGQLRRVACWWNADSLGRFDLADIFAVDRQIGRDMAAIVSSLAEAPAAEYPEAYCAEIEELIRLWRPEVWARSMEIT